MQSTRREFLDDILDFVGHANDSGARDTMERILSRAMLTLWQKRPWRQFLHPTAYELSVVAGTRAYSLPDWFGRVSGHDGKIRNMTTGDELFPSTREAIEEHDPAVGTSLESTGRPRSYYLAGTQPVHTQPASTGDALEVLSSSADDTTVRVLVGGITSANQWTQAQVTLTGTTPVAIGTWKEIHAFGKSYPDGTTATTEHTFSVTNNTYIGDLVEYRAPTLTTGAISGASSYSMSVTDSLGDFAFVMVELALPGGGGGATSSGLLLRGVGGGDQ